MTTALVNARVLTSDTALTRAEAFAVKGGRFTAVGSAGDALMSKLAPRVRALKVAPGVDPEAEMGRYLTAHGFANSPTLLGKYS